MNILKTFEVFLAAPISIIKKKNIKIMHVETNIFAPELPFNVDLSDDSDIQLTVYNNKNMYRLLTSVIYKRRLKNENNKSKVHN